jgi:hypothetical protein
MVSPTHADGVGTVAAIAGPFGAVANGRLMFTGKIPGVDFSVALTVAGTVGAVTPTVTESATGYDFSVANISSAGAGTGTATQVAAGCNADPVMGKFVNTQVFTGDTGAGVMSAAVGKTNSTGSALPSATFVPVETLHAADTTGNTIANTGAEAVLIDNTDGGTSIVTFSGANTHNGIAISKNVVVGTGKVALCGPFMVDDWGATITVTSVDTGIKLSVFQLQSLSARSTVSMAYTAVNYVRSVYDATGAAGKSSRLENMVMKSLARRLSIAFKRLGGPQAGSMGDFPYSTTGHDRP